MIIRDFKINLINKVSGKEEEYFFLSEMGAIVSAKQIARTENVTVIVSQVKATTKKGLKWEVIASYGA